MSNSLDPDQDRQNVGPDLHPNCLQTLSADDKSQLARKDLMVGFLKLLASLVKETFHDFLSSADFFKIFYWNTIRVLNNLNPYQIQSPVRPDLSTYCLPRLSK